MFGVIKIAATLLGPSLKGLLISGVSFFIVPVLKVSILVVPIFRIPVFVYFDELFKCFCN